MIRMEQDRQSDNGAATARVPDPEVAPKAKRRRFSAEYKLRILREAEACSRPGEIGALLRREGLYSSLLSDWRRQREAGALEGLRPRKRGRKPAPEKQRVTELERENARLRHRLEQAEAIIDVQKKLARILEDLPRDGESE
jgi:transposase-like protein